VTPAEGIARELGGASRCGRWWRCRCPVHQSRGPTLALRDCSGALVVVCHAGCSRADIFRELERLALFDQARSENQPPPATADHGADDARRTAIAARIWDKTADGRSSPVERWLRFRGIQLLIPRTLRWARACRHPTGTYCAAMIARVDDVDGNLIAIHRTFLLPDGSAKPKFLLLRV
jgi:hypothetical protein